MQPSRARVHLRLQYGATTREWIEGHLALLFIRVLGLKRFANLGISLGMLQVDKERANRLADIIRNQDLKLMLTA